LPWIPAVELVGFDPAGPKGFLGRVRCECAAAREGDGESAPEQAEEQQNTRAAAKAPRMWVVR
jgi:hypothetical protein